MHATMHFCRVLLNELLTCTFFFLFGFILTAHHLQTVDVGVTDVRHVDSGRGNSHARL